MRGRSGWRTGERKVGRNRTGGRRVQHEIEALSKLRVACLSESAEMACAWIDKKDAAIGRLQQRRHQSATRLVAFGNPGQEAWILDHCAACNAPAMFGVGALLDFLSGNARRAPSWMRTLHLEWLFRLCLEPRRLLKRYTWDMIGFFWICLRAGKQS